MPWRSQYGLITWSKNTRASIFPPSEKSQSSSEPVSAVILTRAGIIPFAASVSIYIDGAPIPLLIVSMCIHPLPPRQRRFPAGELHHHRTASRLRPLAIRRLSSMTAAARVIGRLGRQAGQYFATNYLHLRRLPARRAAWRLRLRLSPSDPR